MGRWLMDVDRTLTRAARGVLRLLGLVCALVGFVLSVVGAVVAHFVPFLRAQPPQLRSGRVRSRRGSSSSHDSRTYMPGALPETTRRRPKRPTNPRHVSFPLEPSQTGKRGSGVSVARKAQAALGRSVTTPVLGSPTALISPRSRERLLPTLPVLQEDSNENRVSPVTELGALRLPIPDVGPSNRAPTPPPASPVPSVSSGTTSESSVAGLGSEPSEVEKAPCCKRQGIKHCPLHRHRAPKPSSSTPIPRTQPYAAPYFFPSPDSPDAVDYVQRVREERRRSAYSSSTFNGSPRPKKSSRSRSPKRVLAEVPQPTQDSAESPSVLPPESALLRQPSDDEAGTPTPTPFVGARRRHSWLHPRSRPSTPQGDGEEKQRRRLSWGGRTHSRTSSMEEAHASEERAAVSATRSFFRRTHKTP